MSVFVGKEKGWDMFGDLGGIGSDVIFPWVRGDECTFTSYFKAAG